MRRYGHASDFCISQTATLVFKIMHGLTCLFGGRFCAVPGHSQQPASLAIGPIHDVALPLAEALPSLAFRSGAHENRAVVVFLSPAAPRLPEQ